jgi:hypothetical protein
MTEATRLHLLREAQLYLRIATTCLREADAPRTLARCRLTQSSIKGAIRNRSNAALREANP